ncbi:hypothetical protein RRG08_005361 [Elysia crispata]|uniref:G-protein coupled receptors family 1 profile domain-containing protein n=1 Tax=Elysia crispata TaxID=231223 RepID=A0AAE1AD00_9GAST|nr:hypothetical protein RRG08_005361 [Elysia crispata]
MRQLSHPVGDRNLRDGRECFTCIDLCRLWLVRKFGVGATSGGTCLTWTWRNAVARCYDKLPVHSFYDITYNSSLLVPHHAYFPALSDTLSIYLGYLWLSLLIGLPGNILIAVVYVVIRHKRTCDWFIFYLSVYDCAVCLFAVPLYLSIETGVWESTGSDLACKLEQFIIFTSQFSSVLILGIIAVDSSIRGLQVGEKLSINISSRKAPSSS